MMDDVPEINVSREPHGSPANPHVVRSATVLDCPECGERLAAVILERMRASLVRTEEVRP
jgi:hypothetical protein